MKTLTRYLTGAAVLALAAACALPLNDVLTDKAQAPLATVGVAADLPANPTAESVVAATTAPEATVAATAPAETPPLAGHLPLAVWGSTGLSVDLLPYDPATGRVFAGEGWNDLEGSYSTALAPDGRTLALLTFSDQATAGRLHFIDLLTWQMAEVTIAVPSYPMLMQFTADSRNILIAGTDYELDELARFDVGTGEELVRVKLPFTPRMAALAPDGSGLLLYGVNTDNQSGINPTVHVAALDLATLNVQWTVPLPGVRDGQYVDDPNVKAEDLWAEGRWSTPAVAWDQAAPRLYVAHADTAELTTVDFAARTVRTVPVAPAQSWLDRLMAFTADTAEAKMLNGVTKQGVLGPDGRLYVLGFLAEMVEEYTETPLGLQVIDVTTGTLLDTIETKARGLSLGADAAGAPVLLLESWGNRHASEVRPLSDPHTVLAELRNVGLQFGHLPNGDAIVLGREDRAHRTVFHLIDTATWTEAAQWPAPSFASPILLP